MGINSVAATAAPFAATLSGKCENAAKALVVLAAFSLVLPTAWLSISLSLMGIFWLLSGRFQYKFQRIRERPAAWAPVALFLLYGIAVLYSSAPTSQAVDYWSKYHKLLYIPIVVSLLDDEVWRRRALNAFFAGMLLVLAISYLKWLGLYPHVDIGQGYYAFKGRIAHSIFMAFTLYLLLERTFSPGKWRWLWGVLAALAVYNNFVLVNGRSGQIAMVAVLVWFFFKRFGWRPALAVVVVVPTLLWTWAQSPWGAEMRLFNIAQEIPSEQGQAPGSAGQRLAFIRTTLGLIPDHPIWGGGTGSYVNEYHAYALRHGYEASVMRSDNPHNEYLLTVQHIGLVGLALLLYVGWLHWRAGRELASTDGNELQALLIVIGIGSLFNSLLLDASEGKFYCLLAGIYLSAWRPELRLSSVARAK